MCDVLDGSVVGTTGTIVRTSTTLQLIHSLFSGRRLWEHLVIQRQKRKCTSNNFTESGGTHVYFLLCNFLFL